MSSSNKNFTVLRFQYEPERSDSEIASQPRRVFNDAFDDQADFDPQQNPRLCKPVTDWCRCGKCERMPTEKECVCCVKIDAIKYFNLNDQECITQHPHFNYIVLLKDVLWTALVALYDRESRGLPERDHVPNRTYRYGAYRQFCWFIHNKLGRGVRRVIPACAVCKIREEYPSVDGRYTGFKGDAEGGELVEMDFSWIAEIEDE